MFRKEFVVKKSLLSLALLALMATTAHAQNMTANPTNIVGPAPMNLRYIKVTGAVTIPVGMSFTNATLEVGTVDNTGKFTPSNLFLVKTLTFADFNMGAYEHIFTNPAPAGVVYAIRATANGFKPGFGRQVRWTFELSPCPTV